MKKVLLILTLTIPGLHLFSSPVFALLQLKQDPKCGSYYQSAKEGEQACSIPTTIQGTRLGNNVLYPNITFSAADIPTEGDLEYLLGKWPEGVLPDNLAPDQCQEIFLSTKDPLDDSHLGVLPKLLSPNDIDYICRPPEDGPSSQTRLEDWYKRRSYGEIVVHPAYIEGGSVACGSVKEIKATFPVWGPMNVANGLWRLFKSPAIDESQVFFENKDANQSDFACLLEQEPKTTLIRNPLSEDEPPPFRIFADSRCAEGECETQAGPEEDVCFLSDNLRDENGNPYVELDPTTDAPIDVNTLNVDLLFSVQHLSGENVTDTTFNAFQAGEDIDYGYATAMVGAPDKNPWGGVAKTHNDLGVYNIFLSPAPVGSASSFGSLALGEGRDVPGIADLSVNVPLRADNDSSKYKALGTVEAMQRYVCLSLISPDEDPSVCDVEVTPQPPEEDGDFSVEKTADPTRMRNEELPKDIEFSIKITAKYKSLKVTITNETTLTKKDGSTVKITSDKEGKDITKWPKDGEGQIDLEAGETWEVSYDVTATKPDFEDSTLTDTVTVSAEKIERPGGEGTCEICGLVGGEPGWKSEALTTILNEAGKAYGVPASVLGGILYYEGWHPRNKRVHQFTDEEVINASKPSGKDPYCVTSSANAKGPFQLTLGDSINGWPKYKAAYKKMAADAPEWMKRPANYTPEICNIVDSAFAAAAKMRTDVEYRGSVGPCNPYRGEPPSASSCNWTPKQISLASCRYYGACGNYVCDADPGGATNCYCERTNSYFSRYACEE